MTCKDCLTTESCRFYKGTQQCSKCYQTKHRRANPHKYNSYRRKYVSANPAKAKDCVFWSRLKSLYNVTREEWLGMLAKQNNACAICKVALHKGRNVATDHVGLVGTPGAQVRGLLCKSCNSAIGLLKESPNNLFAAFNYLEDAKLGITRG